MKPEGGRQADAKRCVERFIGRFDRGEYWLAHEELETLWLQTRERSLKGLIHLAAALVHAERGNWSGSRAKLVSAQELLAEGDSVRGLRLHPVRKIVASLIDQVERQAISGGEGARPAPRLAPAYEGSIDSAVLARQKLPYRARRHREGYRIGRDPRRRDP